MGVIPTETAKRCSVPHNRSTTQLRSTGEQAPLLASINSGQHNGVYIDSATLSRFWAKVDRRGDDECWPWLGFVSAAGYGQFRFEGVVTYAHRASHTINIGPIPEGLTVDHVRARGCILRSCVNPAHLEAITQTDQILRAFGGTDTFCANGHPRIVGEGCVYCDRIYCKRYQDKKRLKSTTLTERPIAALVNERNV